VVGAVAILAIALFVAVTLFRDSRAGAPASSSPGGSAAVVASGSPSAGPSASGAQPSSTTPSATPGTSAIRPDARHGLITFENIRTEADPTGLQQPSQFSNLNTGSAAVSPDGTRVALAVGSDGAQRIVTFATARPNDATTVVDVAGTGEVVRRMVWAGDGQGSVLYNAQKESRGQGGGDNLVVDYSSIRSVDLGSRQVKEIARVSGRSISLFPLAWLPGKQIAAAIEILPIGPAGDYVLVRGTAVERTSMQGGNLAIFSASRDGSRIAAAFGPGVRWWPVDQPAAARELLADSKGRAEYAAFRPGSEELGVRVAAASASAGVPPPGHFEIWNVSTGKQRVVSPTAGFRFWRVDGSAAIDGSQLIDPDTGAVTQLPGTFKLVDVVAF
jgi:hypothetical protein